MQEIHTLEHEQADNIRYNSLTVQQREEHRRQLMSYTNQVCDCFVVHFEYNRIVFVCVGERIFAIGVRRHSTIALHGAALARTVLETDVDSSCG